MAPPTYGARWEETPLGGMHRIRANVAFRRNMVVEIAGDDDDAAEVAYATADVEGVQS